MSILVSGASPYITLIRPSHWVKNGFVIAPLLFAGAFFLYDAVVNAVIAGLFFCVASSATYVLNDLFDLEKDRNHPSKCRERPIAAGTVTPTAAKLLLGLLWAAVFCAWAFNPWVATVIFVYLLLNIAYSLHWKSVPVVDLFCVSSGFVLRVCAGAWAIDLSVSGWMAITTLCLSLYLATIKRQQELKALGDRARAVLGSYSLPLLERYAQLAATCSMVFYGLFIVTVRPTLAITIPLVLFGLFRYWYVVESSQGGESPTDVVWTDAPLILTVLIWAITSAVVIGATKFTTGAIGLF